MPTDERAELEAFCARAYPRLVGGIAPYCGDVHLAEELAQEALLRACRRWSSVRTMESPLGWTYRVAVNLASSEFRRRRVERRARQRLDARARTEVHQDPDVADRLVVTEALGRLPARQRRRGVDDGLVGSRRFRTGSRRAGR